MKMSIDSAETNELHVAVGILFHEGVYPSLLPNIHKRFCLLVFSFLFF